ncbi:MAG: hypothetical protein QXG01_02545 [Candidatus Bathyarchaeia archaeon]
MISACVLIRSERGKFEEVVKGEKVFAVLGRFDAVVDLEAPDFQTLGSIVVKMGKMSGVVFTETLVELQRK